MIFGGSGRNSQIEGCFIIKYAHSAKWLNDTRHLGRCGLRTSGRLPRGCAAHGARSGDKLRNEGRFSSVDAKRIKLRDTERPGMIL